MKIKKILLIGLFIFGLIMAAASQAAAQPLQDAVVVNSQSIGNFFISLLAGVILALGFQMLLTILSIACGFSILGNVEDKFNRGFRKAAIDTPSPLLQITTGLGIWILATTSLSLFLASIFAVKISLISDNRIGLTLGLVIWAAFFILMTYFEMKSARSILGGIFNMVFSGFKSSGQMIQKVFGKSRIEKTADIIREELVQALRDPKLSSSVHNYLRDFKVEGLEWDKIRKELPKLMSDLEVNAQIRDEKGIERQAFIRLAQRHPHFSKEDVEKLGQVYDEIRNKKKESQEGGAELMGEAQKMMPGIDEDARQIKEKIESYLSSTKIDALKPENLKADINKIVSDPKGTKSVVLNRIKQFDHPTLVAIVTKKTNMSREQADKVANRVESVLASIKDKAGQSMEKVEEIKNGNGRRSLRNMIEDRIINYFNSLQRSEFNYEGLKSDFERILHDPKASLEILRNRLKMYDRESILTLVSSQPNISREEAEKIVKKIEEARDNVLKKAEEIEEQVQEKAQEAKEVAIHQAENIRQSVAAAAWWLFGTAVISAWASAVGGMLALS